MIPDSTMGLRRTRPSASDDVLRLCETAVRTEACGAEFPELLGWVKSIETKDPYTAGHCERVARYASRLAAVIGFEGRDLAWFAIGALLHDVGKTAVPSAVLTKCGPLTPEEWSLMRDHTVHGDRIAMELDLPWEIRPMVRSHHERWDGSGYPDRLRGVEIPLTARVLCIADVYDALTSTRCYRPAIPCEAALRVMESETGAVLDPGLFHLFRSARCYADDAPDPRAPARLAEIA